jgi:DNA-directed RNA polymerase subunit RPC12/RpoP
MPDTGFYSHGPFWKEKRIKCPSCGSLKKNRHYLCSRCWYRLSEQIRNELQFRDCSSADRLANLYKAIRRGVPLEEIKQL